MWSIFCADMQSSQDENCTFFSSILQSNIVMQKKMRNHFPMCENMSRMTKGHSRLFSPTYHHLPQNFNRKVEKSFNFCHLFKELFATLSSFYRKIPLVMIKEWENYRCSKCVAVNFHRSLYGNHLSKTSTFFFRRTLPKVIQTVFNYSAL